MTSAMKIGDKDMAFAVALALLLALSLAAFFCDPHWQPLQNPRIAWTINPPPAAVPTGGISR